MEVYLVSGTARYTKCRNLLTWWNSIFRREQFLVLKCKRDISKMHLARRFYAKARFSRSYQHEGRYLSSRSAMKFTASIFPVQPWAHVVCRNCEPRHAANCKNVIRKIFRGAYVARIWINEACLAAANVHAAIENYVARPEINNGEDYSVSIRSKIFCFVRRVSRFNSGH